jgi:hypothetical protein
MRIDAEQIKNFDAQNSTESVTSKYYSESNPFDLLVSEKKLEESDNTTIIPFETFKQEILGLRETISMILKNEELLKQFLNPENFSTNNLFKELKSRGANIDQETLNLYLKSHSWLSPSQSVSVKSIIEGFENYYGSAKNLFNVINTYANKYFQTKYLLDKIIQAKNLIAKYFPEIFVDYNYKVNVEDVNYEENASHSRENSPGKSYPTHILTLRTKEKLKDIFDINDANTKGLFEKEYVYKRKIYDLIIMIHEYSHGIFDELAQPQKDIPKNYTETPYKTMTEGFAVLIEFLFCDRKDNEYFDDFSSADLEDLKKFKKQRMQSLNSVIKAVKSGKNIPERSAYQEGFSFMFRLFKSKGLNGVKEFIKNIDPQKAFSLNRDDEIFKNALKSSEEMIKLLGKQKDNN